MSGPRVGGKEGRYILFTGVGCKGLPAISLLLGDEVSGKVYFVDELSYEMDANDHRVPYDIHENVVVYVKDWLPHYRDWGRDYQAIVVYEFDESQMWNKREINVACRAAKDGGPALFVACATCRKRMFSWLSKAFCDRSDADHWVGLVTLYSSSYAS